MGLKPGEAGYSRHVRCDLRSNRRNELLPSIKDHILTHVTHGDPLSVRGTREEIRSGCYYVINGTGDIAIAGYKQLPRPITAMSALN